MQAGCEDHAIVYGPAARAEQAGQHRLNDQASPYRFHDSQSGQKRPCNGPSCSRQSPHSPLLPNNEPPKKTSDDPLLVSWLDSLLFVEATPFPRCLTASALPAGHPDSLLDPPRA